MRPLSSDRTSPGKLDATDIAIPNRNTECRQDPAQPTHNQIESAHRSTNKADPTITDRHANR